MTDWIPQGPPAPAAGKRRAGPQHAKRHHKTVRPIRPGEVVADVLVTVGMFLLLYVVWQLFYTTWRVSGGIDDAITGFEDAHPGPQVYTEARYTTAPPAVGEVVEGEVYGVLHMPGWDWKSIPLAQGVAPWVLDQGFAGHYPSTQQVGEIGNFGLAAHRRTAGDSFRFIHTLQKGDPVVVETAEAFVVYEVTDYQIVAPNETWVLDPVPGETTVPATKRLMTMTTCNPMYGNYERYIVWSEMAYWTPKSEGRPEILEGEPGVGHD